MAQDKEPSTNSGPAKPTLLATLAPFIALFSALGLLMLGLQPFLLNILLDNAVTPLELIRGYHIWYILLFVFCGVGAVLVLTAGWLSVKKGVRSWQAIKLTIAAVIFQLFISGAMLFTEEVPSLLVQSKADMDQIRNSRLETDIVLFNQSQTSPAGLPGPFAKGQPKPFGRYSALGESSGDRWQYFYIPNSLEFEPDRERPYDSTKRTQWNLENAARYQITYTENLHVVVSVEIFS